MQTMRLCLAAVLVFGLLAIPIVANADWTPLDGQAVGEGIDYQAFPRFIGSPLYVTRMPIGDENYAIEACSAHMTVDTVHYEYEDEEWVPYGTMQAPETIANMVQNYNGTINSYGKIDDVWWPTWGSTSEPIAAINGGPHNRNASDTGVDITRGHIQRGFCAKPLYTGGLSGFIWTGHGTPHIGGCVSYGDQRAYYGELDRPIDRVNDTPATGNELVMYTPQTINGKTPTNTVGTLCEVIVRCPHVPTINAGGSSTGKVAKISNYNIGGTPVEFDCVVLSGAGTAGTELQTLQVGTTVTIDRNVTNLYTDQQLPGYQNGCETPDASVPWENAYSFVGGFTQILGNGSPLDLPTPDWGEYRTVVAYNNTYVYFIVARWVTLYYLSYFCQNDLGCTNAIALDNGSSTQMWVKDRPIPFVNKSWNLRLTGPENRRVADGLMMCRIHTKETSIGDYNDTLVGATYYPCRPTLRKTTQVHTGPGSGYPEIGTVSKGYTVTIQPHDLNGVKSTNGTYWWYVRDYNYKYGWINEDAFPQTHIQVIPASVQGSCYGNGTLTALGDPTQFKGYPVKFPPEYYSIRWQKYVSGGENPGWTDLADTAGKYSGTATNTLTVQNLQPEDMAMYRCRFTPSNGLGGDLISESSSILVTCGGG